MATYKKFEELSIWQLSRELCKEIYKITNYDSFSKDLRFVSQIRAAGGSIMDIIAEGFDRRGNKEFVYFLYVSNGSCGEVRSQLHRAFDCHYISEDEYKTLVKKSEDLSNAILHFVDYLKKSDLSGSKYKNVRDSEPKCERSEQNKKCRRQPA